MDLKGSAPPHSNKEASGQEGEAFWLEALHGSPANMGGGGKVQSKVESLHRGGSVEKKKKGWCAVPKFGAGPAFNFARRRTGQDTEQ